MTGLASDEAGNIFWIRSSHVAILFTAEFLQHTRYAQHSLRSLGGEAHVPK